MNSFNNKVKYERQVLNIINNYYNEPQLTGITSASLNQWKSSHQTIDLIVRHSLEKLSLLICSLTERSGERFDNEHKFNNEIIITEIDKLDKALKKRVI